MVINLRLHIRDQVYSMTKMYLNSLSSPEEDSKKLFFKIYLVHLTQSFYQPQVDRCALSCSVVSDSLRPHGLQLTGLLCSWGFSRQEHWNGLPCRPSGEPSQPRDQIQVSRIQVDFYHLSQQGSPGGQICHHKLIENKESYLRHTSFQNSYSATYIKFRETCIECLYPLKILMLKSNLHQDVGPLGGDQVMRVKSSCTRLASL